MEKDGDMEKSGVYAPDLLEFVRQANEFCLWLEEASAGEGVAFIQEGLKFLPSLYSQVLKIEQTEPLIEGGNEKFVTEQDWSAVYQRVLHLLGPYNNYLRVADSDEFDRSDLVTHTISEDLADIYQDLKDFTQQFRQGIEEIMNDAVWEVLQSFEQYWGEKLLSASGALHKLYIKRIDPQEEAADQSAQGGIPSYDNSLFTRLQDSNEEEV